MATPEQSVSELHEHLGFWLRFVSNHVSYAFTRKVEEQGVTVAEWVILRGMYSQEELHPSQLAVQCGMTRGAISKLIERLCQKQLVERTTVSSDRRYQTVRLTTAGRKLLPLLARLADENDHECFGHLSDAERRDWVNRLRDLVARHGWKEIPVN